MSSAHAVDAFVVATGDNDVALGAHRCAGYTGPTRLFIERFGGVRGALRRAWQVELGERAVVRERVRDGSIAGLADLGRRGGSEHRHRIAQREPRRLEYVSRAPDAVARTTPSIRARSEPEPGQEALARFSCRRRVDPTHRTATPRASFEVRIRSVDCQTWHDRARSGTAARRNWHGTTESAHLRLAAPSMKIARCLRDGRRSGKWRADCFIPDRPGRCAAANTTSVGLRGHW